MGKTITGCQVCDCAGCTHLYNSQYDDEVCRFRTILCSCCNGKHCMTFCPGYNMKGEDQNESESKQKERSGTFGRLCISNEFEGR